MGIYIFNRFTGFSFFPYFDLYFSMADEKFSTQHFASSGGDDVIDDTLKQDQIVASALVSGGDETKLSITQLFRMYWPGAMWSMLLSLALVMDGMDTGLVSSFLPEVEPLN